MAWRQHDLDALVGRRISLRVAADPSYRNNPHSYSGPWTDTRGGTAARAAADDRGEYVLADYTDGTWVAWIAGQPIYLTTFNQEGS